MGIPHGWGRWLEIIFLKPNFFSVIFKIIVSEAEMLVKPIFHTNKISTYLDIVRTFYVGYFMKIYVNTIKKFDSLTFHFHQGHFSKLLIGRNIDNKMRQRKTFLENLRYDWINRLCYLTSIEIMYLWFVNLPCDVRNCLCRMT